MKPFLPLPVVYSLLLLCGCAGNRYTAGNAHAHNDYAHPVPFYPSWNAGFGSIEADIFPGNGRLYVAHDKKQITEKNTLRSLYLQPLLSVMAGDSTRKLRLLVDIKEDYRQSLSLLINELQPLRNYLSDTLVSRQLTILISGQRPSPAEYQLYPAYIFFDDDLKSAHTPAQWKRVAQVSLPFNKLSSWKGKGRIPALEKAQVKHKIDSVHAAGKPIRFWAAPDTLPSWRLQKRLRADLIGTDKVNELKAWFQNQ